MNELLFLQKREQDWKRLTLLCDKADASPAQLRSAELKEFVRLYRKVSDDLAQARTKSSNLQLIAFLNDLCARAYSQIYRPAGKNAWLALAGLPALAARTFRRRWRAVSLSFGVFVASAILADACLTFAPATRANLIPGGLEEVFDHWKHGQMTRTSHTESSAMTLFYGFNNPLVATVTGAIGAGTFGVLTAQKLYENGAILGALYHECAGVGRGWYLLVHIMPHGVTELSGAIVAGAAGFVMGGALIAPGRRRRGEALRQAGKDAVVLLGTSIALMYLAAPIEGFFSFNPDVPDIARVAFIVVSAGAWGVFWTGYGRKGEEALEPVEESVLPSVVD